MKHKLIILLSFLISCSTSTEKNEKDKLVSKQIDTISQINSVDSISEVNTDYVDCIFDQVNQTDEFLKNIEELKNYKWDYEKRTATIILENKDTLLITRGGCNHFGVSAEFRLSNDTADYSDWINVYDKVLWIAKVLNQEFAYKDIKNGIDSNKITLFNHENGDDVFFTNQHLQDNHYQISRSLNENKIKIILSYYIN